jgi:MYXO-CTERM domain-containing protein
MSPKRLATAFVLCSLTLAPASVAATDYSLPLDSLHYNQYITAYFDVGGNQDWNCGSVTYGGHRGTDIGIGGFGPMAEGRPILAAADGEVIHTHDGEADMCTSGSCGGGGGFGNHVIVLHADGKRTIYAHLKRFSVLVETGQSVACGQPLGEVGSSGNSTGPHLHFEVRTEAGYLTADDPYTGPCGGPVSWWLSQGGYQSLPVLSCTDFVDPWPLFALDGSTVEIDGAPPQADEARAGVGQVVVQHVEVHNDSHPLAEGHASGLRVGFEIDPVLRVAAWKIESSCEEGWCPSPADSDPANPTPETIDGAFALELGTLAPGGRTRIGLEVVGEMETDEAPAHTRFFVSHVDGVYAKASWDAAFEDSSGRQTWNDGDLRLELAVIVDPVDSDDAGGTGGDASGGGDSASTSGSSAGVDETGASGVDEALPAGFGVGDTEGCSCSAKSTSRTGAVWLAMLILLATRRRSTGARQA